MAYFGDVENMNSLFFQGFSLNLENCKFRFLSKWLFEADGIIYIENCDTDSVRDVIFAIKISFFVT